MFNYSMTPSGKRFHESDKYLKLLCGPYGSGKSCCCAVDTLANACAQFPAPDGVRYTRVGVIRATYNELVNTTRKSILEVMPPGSGTITSAVGTSPKGTFTFALGDGTSVHLEYNLVALQTGLDAHKLLSMNWTYAWINEATGVTPEVLELVTTRVARYPPEDMGGIRWAGVLLDFNRPEQGSWLDTYIKNPAPEWEVIMQPPAAFKIDHPDGRVTYEVNPLAENLRNQGSKEPGDPEDLDPIIRGMRNYRHQIDMKLKNGREDVVMNQYCMLDVPIVEGKPVYMNFSVAKHTIADDLVPPLPYNDIIIGMDQSGIHPAAVILQFQPTFNKWVALDEMFAEDEGLELFLNSVLLPRLRTRYATNPVICAIDPSNQRDSWQAVTPKDRLEALGLFVENRLTNNPRLRIQTVEHMLNLDAGGLLISKNCEMLVRGFIHEYRYRRLRAGGTVGASYTPSPEKNAASHPHDALQYAALLIMRGADDAPASEIEEMAQRLSERRQLLNRVV